MLESTLFAELIRCWKFLYSLSWLGIEICSIGWANQMLESALFAELIRCWKFLYSLSWLGIEICFIGWANQMLESALFAELIRYGPWEMSLILELIRFGKFLYLLCWSDAAILSICWANNQIYHSCTLLSFPDFEPIRTSLKVIIVSWQHGHGQSKCYVYSLPCYKLFTCMQVVLFGDAIPTFQRIWPHVRRIDWYRMLIGFVFDNAKQWNNITSVSMDSGPYLRHLCSWKGRLV
jgi:hypothetical protein